MLLELLVSVYNGHIRPIPYAVIRKFFNSYRSYFDFCQFRILQQINKLFLRSSYGQIPADSITDILEKAVPGFSSYMIARCPAGKSSPVRTIFPMEELFQVVSDGIQLDFDYCCGLLDLSVEIQRQASERQRLYESFADPHPNIIFGQLKNHWFSQLVYQRITATNYHVTFVSSARFIDVSKILTSA